MKYNNTMLIHTITFYIQLCRCSGGEETGDGLGRSVLRGCVLSTKGTKREVSSLICVITACSYVNVTEDSGIVFLGGFPQLQNSLLT